MSPGGLASPLEALCQLAQAGVGLPFQGLLGLPVASEAGAHFWEKIGSESEDLSFALTPEGQSRGGVGLALGAVAGGFATTAAEGDEGPAKQEGAGGWMA